MPERSGVLFREVQRFRQPWLWIVILLPVMFLVSAFGYAMIQQLILGKPCGNRPLSDVALLIVGGSSILLCVGICYIFYTAALVAEVRSDGIYVRFFPFHRSFVRIPFSEIGAYKVVTYDALRKYGGWGIRTGKRVVVYNVSGSCGVQLELLDGGQVLIGSQRAEEFVGAIDLTLRNSS